MFDENFYEILKMARFFIWNITSFCYTKSRKSLVMNKRNYNVQKIEMNVTLALDEIVLDTIICLSEANVRISC